MSKPQASFASTGVPSGIGAGLLAAVVMLLLGQLWGAPVPPQLLADRLTAYLPASVFSAILGQLESQAKPFLFVGLLVGQLVLGGLIGGFAAAALKRGTRPFTLFLVLAVGAWALLALVIAPLGGIGLAGSSGTAGAGRTIVAFALVAVTFAASLTVWLLGASPAAETNESRRQLLRGISVGVPTLLAGVYVGRFFLDLSGKSQIHGETLGADGLPPALTSPDDFYEVSKNFDNPNVAASGWKLQIDGMVEQQQTYTYDQIKARPAQQHIATLECISNEIGDKYISNGEWTGFPFHTLLDEARVKPGVVDVVLYAADGYADSIPLAAALDPNTFLVYELGGQPLTSDHGYPARLLVPNIYGMKNVKWLNRVNLVNYDFKGYWQERGWSDVARVQTMSRIDVPQSSATVPVNQPALVGGIAFAGNRGIQKVQVSFDGAKTWTDASVEAPLSPLSWVRWSYHWTPTAQGKFQLAVRAADGTGQFQTATEEDPAPDGATGYHKITVKVGPAGSNSAGAPPPTVPTQLGNSNYSP